MANEAVKSIQFIETVYPKVLAIANELAILENRKPHDSIKNLIIEEGQKKIDRLKLYAAQSKKD